MRKLSVRAAVERTPRSWSLSTVMSFGDSPFGARPELGQPDPDVFAHAQDSDR